MFSWERISNGVRKYYSWGCSEVYGVFEDCFSSEELDLIIGNLKLVENDLNASQKLVLKKLIGKKLKGF